MSAVASHTSSISPVIVIGMHRSGTSMVSRMLESMGIFVGGRKESNHEATFFLEIDRWLFSQCGASWENPQPVHYLLEQKEIRARTAEYLTHYLLDSPRAISFLGWKQYLRYGSIFRLPRLWGWKCPLSTFTLPFWLDVFPNAKVIHVYRHGIDVANSLCYRSLKGMRQTRLQQLYYNLRFIHWLRPKAGGFIQGIRCATLEGGFSLWEEYLAEARRHVLALGKNAIEIKYEELLEKPGAVLPAVAEFCDVPPGSVEAAANLVKQERAYAYLRNPELRALADRQALRLELFGY
jgi:hypothetical protein